MIHLSYNMYGDKALRYGILGDVRICKILYNKYCIDMNHAFGSYDADGRFPSGMTLGIQKLTRFARGLDMYQHLQENF